MTEHSRIEALITRAALKDRNAFSSLYDATSAKLFSVCLQVLNDQQAAEDALQDSYIKIWSKADRYHTNGMSPMTWLITIARNTSIDRLRSNDCLETLESEKTEAVCGVYLHGYSYAELASRYNIPINTVRTWLRRSLLKLKGCLSNE